MATGYTRQSSAQIVNGNVINDSDFNNEYNQLQSFANGSSGHDHSGGTGLGPRINLTAATPGVTGVLDAQFGGIHSAAVDPVVGNDNTQGYVVGCIWFNTAATTVFQCTDTTTGAAVWVKRNGNSTASDPIVTSDNAHGYIVGSFWYNTSSTVAWVCVDNTNGAAVWQRHSTIINVAGTANQITTSTVSGITTLALSSALILPGTLTVNPTAGTSAVLATTSVTGLTNTGLTTLSGGLTVNPGGTSSSLNTTQITGLTTTQNATMAGLTSSGLVTANGGLTVNAGATSASLNTTQITGLTTTQNATMAGLTSSGLITSNGGLTVNTGTVASTLNTTQINGLTATLLGTLTGGSQTVTGGVYQGSKGKINALGSISGSNVVDYTLGNIVTATQNNNTLTFTFSNIPASGTYASIEFIITLDATPHTVTFTGVTWDTVMGAPTLVASKDLHVVLEWNDGSTPRGTFIGCF